MNNLKCVINIVYLESVGACPCGRPLIQERETERERGDWRALVAAR